MSIESLCRRELVAVSASTPVRQAAAVMRNEHVGALAITDPFTPGRVIGMLTDRDLVVELLATDRSVDVAIGSLCHTGLASVPASATVQQALQAMQRAGVRRLLVMGDDNAVLGLVSTDDLLEAVAGDLSALAATLRKGVAEEGSRERARSRAEGGSPQPLYASSHEP